MPKAVNPSSQMTIEVFDHSIDASASKGFKETRVSVAFLDAKPRLPRELYSDPITRSAVVERAADARFARFYLTRPLLSSGVATRVLVIRE